MAHAAVLLVLFGLFRSSAARGVSVTIRNLANESVNVSWLEPAPAGSSRRKRLPQLALRHRMTASIASYAGHEFVVSRAAAPCGPELQDRHENCAFWASLDECDTNPTYMRTSCAGSCADGADDDASVTFSVAEAPEMVSVVIRADGTWAVEREGTAVDALAAVARAFEACGGGGDEDACVGEEPAESSGRGGWLWGIVAERFGTSPLPPRLPAPSFERCVGRKLEGWLAPRLAALALEKDLFETSYAMMPVPSPGPLVDDAEDVAEVDRLCGAALRPLDVAAACPAADRRCVDVAVRDAAVGVSIATDVARRATRRRATDKRNATCATSDRTTPAVATETWRWDPRATSPVWGDDGPPAAAPVEPPRRVSHLFKPEAVPAALISVVDDFISEAECAAIMAQARPRLGRATHMHEGDSAHVSKVRDSQQATVHPAAGDHRDLADPIARVKARAVALANHLSNYTLSLDGQEDLMAVQYDPGQQYLLHCDGSCDGTPFRSGGRLATVLMYCATAEGGGTAFPNANVYVVPEKGQAAYFHFRGPDPSGAMEDWHTEHSACPVRTGEKWAVTLWLRDGVSKELPHTRFDPSGGPATTLPDGGGGGAASTPAPATPTADPTRATVSAERPAPKRGAADGGPAPDADAATWGDWRPRTEGWTRRNNYRLEQIRRIESQQERWDAMVNLAVAGLLAPNFTEIGYKIAQTPPHIHKKLNDTLRAARGLYQEDAVDQISGPRADFVPLGRLWDEILTDLQAAHEAWSGVALVPSNAYGIRTYKPTNTLLLHTDKFQTHVISSIIHIDRDVDEPWPIVIEGFDGISHEVDLQPGQTLFYESAKCIHGRPRPMKGRSYSAIFVHYRPADWTLSMDDVRPLIAPLHLAPDFYLPPDPAYTPLRLVGTGYYEPECQHGWCDLSPVWPLPAGPREGDAATIGDEL